MLATRCTDPVSPSHLSLILRRHRLAQSDIWEEDVEIEISEILPTSPEYEASVESKRVRFRERVVVSRHVILREARA